MAEAEAVQIKTREPPGPHERRVIAVRAWTTEGAVRNFLLGKSQKPVLAERIARAMREMGYPE